MSESDEGRYAARKISSEEFWSELITVERSDDGIYRAETPIGRDDRVFLEAYAALRRGEGRADIAPGELLALPSVAQDDERSGEWRERGRSLAWLSNWLEERDLSGPILDCGAGNCWLSWNLMKLGFNVCALDLSDDRFDGLGAGEHFIGRREQYFARVQSSFNELPIADASIGLVIFNGALHYTKSLNETIGEALRVLVPGGKIIIMDSPVYRTRWSGEKMIRERGGPEGARFLVRSEILEIAKTRKLSVTMHPRNHGVFHLIRRMVQALRLGREPAAMPWIVLSAG